MPGDQFQKPDVYGVGPRLPVAARQSSARAWHDRHLQPLVLRRSAGAARASRTVGAREAAEASQAQGAVGAALPGDERLRALPGRQWLRNPQILPAPVEG